MNNKGKLYLIPVPISEITGTDHLPLLNLSIVKQLTQFIAEDAKTARKFLKLMGYEDISKAEIHLLNEHTRPEELPELYHLLDSGSDIGLMSDAGCPGIADPGDVIVRMAHKKGMPVVPLTGPSSIVLSIMASGFNGQNFAFNGYLPIDSAQRVKRIRELEQTSRKLQQAQFFIETPYRNEQLLQAMIQHLSAGTMIFIGKNLHTQEQYLRSLSAEDWKRTGLPKLGKIPVVFGIMAL